MPSSRHLRICFDLTGNEHWHRVEWERMLAVAAAGGREASLVEREDAADCVITTGSPWHFARGGRIFGRRPPETGGPRRFVWDASDFPTGRDPGFYCSLPRPLFAPGRHRSFSYPIRYNECVSPGDLGEARYLMGFVGGITSGLRGRMLRELDRNGEKSEMKIVVQNGDWSAMFDRSGLPVKRFYADTLRSVRFFLCPRGNGVGSVRLFETMESARVPVIISDAYVLPGRIDWEACSVRVRERDLAKLPSLLRERAADWPRMAAEARRVWEQNFSPDALLDRLALDLRELLDAATEETWASRGRLALFWAKGLARRQAVRLRASLRDRVSA